MPECNIVPSTVFTADNLDVLRGINSECIDLVYLDPPFNSKKTWTGIDGSEAEGAEFRDTWTAEDIDTEWVDRISEHPNLDAVINLSRVLCNVGMVAYLTMLAIRLLELHRILKATGSIYLHCDTRASHYIRLLLDAIFGKERFINEIAWCYTSPSATNKNFPKKHDTIYFYGKSDARRFYKDSVRIPYSSSTDFKGKYKQSAWGGTGGAWTGLAGKVVEDWWADVSPTARVHSERVGYPTQKPLALLGRIIKASTNEGDIVLDPFAGSGTTCIAAEKWHRLWIGIDISVPAADIISKRFDRELDLLNPPIIYRTDIPVRDDFIRTLET